MTAKQLFETLREIPLSEVPSLLSFPLATFLPKQSNVLTKNLLKDIISINEPRLLVIIGHLYFDYILGKMVDRKPNIRSKCRKYSFYSKLELLNSHGILTQDAYECLLSINRLRNRFAHNIFYNIADWDPKEIPYVLKCDLRVPRRKDLCRAFNIVVIKLSFMALLKLLLEKNRWLYLENIPKGYKPQSV